MANKTTICNMALGRIRHNRRVANIDTDQTEEARALRTVFDMSRDFVLREHPWGFAKTIAALAETGNTVLPGWSYEYDYPTNCLYARQIVDEYGTRTFRSTAWQTHWDSTEVWPATKIPFDVMTRPDSEATVIVCDISPAYLVYTMRITDTEKFDPGFVNALAWYLGAEVGSFLKADDDILNLALKMYRSAVMQASATTQNERTPDTAPDSPSVAIR